VLLRIIALPLDGALTPKSAWTHSGNVGDFVVLKLLFQVLVLALDQGHWLCVRAARCAHVLLTHHWTQVKTAIYLVLSVVIVGSGASFAVVSLGPDAALLQSRTVVKDIDVIAQRRLFKLEGGQVDASKEALSNQGFEDLSAQFTDASLPKASPLSEQVFHTTEWSRNSDTAQQTLRRLGIFDPQALAFILSTPSTKRALLGKNQRLLHAVSDQSQQLRELNVRWSDEDPLYFNRLSIKRSASGFEVQQNKVRFQTQLQVAAGRIKSSLFQATDLARVPDAVATQLAEIFSGDIDFHRALRQGDRFSLIYEVMLADGEVLKTGNILNAEFINRGKSYQAVWFSDPSSAKGDYYSMDGMNLRRTFLASPLSFSRVTSGFSMRMHPILQTWKAHLGVDYAAPTGAPVRSVGNGFVESAGYQNGFGNVVFIKHPQGPLTVYAHLSRIDVKKGHRVSQGEVLGAVGATGWATGPHLHFEFRLNGQHQDPMTLAKQNTPIPLASELKPQFLKQAQWAKSALSGLGSLETVDLD
jgi:murein DD-endopeptidase MepM/ murein hydrolase activator NlpD